MKHTIEKLVQQRKEKEAEFQRKLEALKSDIQALSETGGPLKSKQQRSRLNEILTALADTIHTNASLTAARDREWDALGSNHVGMIFNSLEWKVNRLSAETRDAALLIKTFTGLREKLTRLLDLLEERKDPSPKLVTELLSPLDDWRYTAFENRYRGDAENVRRQQESYLDYFPEKGKIMDLGCGRGEFLELLEDRGREAEGVDISRQMIDICRDKGLTCERADLLEKLSASPDNALSGVFSSQVVEHLPPTYLQRLVETIYAKLRPAGTVILETVNPLSVFALVQIYFLDMTHQQPLHPQALRFLLENAGFERIEIRYDSPLTKEALQSLPAGDEIDEVLNRNFEKLNDLLYAPANYAVIGVKPSPTGP